MIPVYEIVSPGCKPHLGSAGAAGLDLRADTKDIFIKPGVEYTFSTGIKVAIPAGWVGLVFPRSGMGVNYKLRLLNTVGVIDSDYRGEIKIACTFDRAFWLEANERICQLVTTPCRVDYVEGTVNSDTERGDAGFGSSGRA